MTPEDPFGRLVGPASAAVLVAAALSLWDLGGMDSLASPALGVAGLMALALELKAVSAAVWGFSSCGWVVILAFKSTSLTHCAAGSTLYVVFLARTLLKGSPSPVGRLCELARDWLPATVASLAVLRPGLAMGLSPWVVLSCAAVVWVSLANSLSHFVAQRLPEDRARLWREGMEGHMPRTAAAALGGLATAALLGATPPWSALAMLGPFLYLQHSLHNRSHLVSRAELDLARQRLHSASTSLEEQTRELGSAREQLRIKLEERVLLEDLAARLSQNPGLEGTARVFLDILGRLVPCSSLVFFLPRQEELEPAYALTSRSEQLSASRLLRLHEPMITEAWQTGQPVTREALPGGQIFPEERWALAYPLHGLSSGRPPRGVLYAGSVCPWSKDQWGLMTMMAQQAALAMASAFRYDAQRQALGYHSEAHHQLLRSSQSMSLLLARLSDLLGALDSSLALEAMQQLAGELFAGHGFMLVLGDQQEVRRSRGDLQEEAALEVARTVIASRHPLVIQELPSSRFPPLRPGDTWLMAAPLPGAGEPAGALIVTSAFTLEPEAFHLLEVTAGLFGGIWQNARLREQLVTAFQQLQESQAQLVQSSKLAAVGQLAAGVAHELNNPLGAVLLSIESSQKMANRPEVVGTLLDQARIGVVRAREIVAKLLYYSRDARVGRRRLDLCAVARDTLALVRRQLDLDKIQCQLLGQPEACWALANESELHQVLLNLLLNARDALVDGPERVVEVECGRQEQRVFLRVQDRGPGMEPDVLRRATEPFFTTKPVGRGTGLGLSVSHQIVEAHGGQLEIASQPGQGTCVTVWLPACPGGDSGP